MTQATPATSEPTSPTPHGATSLRALLDDGADHRAISSFLESLPQARKLEEVLSIRGKGVGELYHAVKGAPPIDLAELVPPEVKTTVIFEGRNTLPAFSRFQKRFYRLGDGTIVGYNHNPAPVMMVTGPGYFLVKEAAGVGEHASELLFDYVARPTAEPAGWPAFRPNEKGLSRAVFGYLNDFCRRVADGVLVGKAYKNGSDIGQYFSLTRAD